jgi:hypothetical protein
VRKQGRLYANRLLCAGRVIVRRKVVVHRQVIMRRQVCAQSDLVRALRNADLMRMRYSLKVIRSSSSADKSLHA